MREDYGPPSAGTTPTSKAASSSTSSNIERETHVITCKRSLDIAVDPPLVSHDPTSASLCKKVIEDNANPTVLIGSGTGVRSSTKRILDVDVDLTIDGDTLATGGGVSATVGGSSSLDGAADMKAPNSKCAKTGFQKYLSKE